MEGSWLNLNRACNLRCKWCYASGTGFSSKDDMSLKLAKELIDLKKQLGVKRIIVLGGEPLVYRNLWKVVKYCTQKGIGTTIVTNGVLFSQDKVIQKVLENPPQWISVSLKAHDRQSYIELTEKDAFNRTIKGMNNLSKNDIPFDVSITFSSLISKELVQMAKIAHENGANNVVITFCTTVFEDNKPVNLEMDNPLDIARVFLESYDALDIATEGKMVIGQSLPSCLFPKEFLKHLNAKQQISFGCSVLQKSGVVFDPQGNVLVCNCLHDLKIGQYGVDFNNYKSFVKFWNNETTNQIFNGMSAYPSEVCIDCDDFATCGGGCPLRWFVYKPESIIPK
ncbi:MAG: hypothetical protein A2271_00485 [Candidatus Moranbacteria bacterium RIFOXYA12_FULL_35_19]|nr:MAG: hypothetical protein A2489_02390 [Candidatus Moranbacteria bacterium RIFOXYC12_FULL_36_13]OGI35194.1 MAG: hypothetical protein A2271_00485 [Candidatus Moranbacteria bacterium RIFOXYA12_FULL_35_19]